MSKLEILLWFHSDSFTECRDTAILQSPPKCHFAPQMPLYEKSSWKIEQILCLQWSETKWQIGGGPMFFGYCAPNWLSSQMGNLTNFQPLQQSLVGQLLWSWTPADDLITSHFVNKHINIAACVTICPPECCDLFSNFPPKLRSFVHTGERFAHTQGRAPNTQFSNI